MTAILQGWLWLWITLEGFDAIKQRTERSLLHESKYALISSHTIPICYISTI